jgi:D-glycero-D-manno-heptose 1,7-bisphosphate phosphatase
MTRMAVFLDRDGVINRAYMCDGLPRPPASPQELEILPQVPQAVAGLKARGYEVFVVTNQPDVSRGKVNREMVDGIHRRLKRELRLSAIFTCFHDDADGCECRKPKPGLIYEAAREFNIDLSSSFVVGDRSRDVEAGRRAGCRTFFIDYKYPEPPPSSCDYRVASLAEACKIILAGPDRP